MEGNDLKRIITDPNKSFDLKVLGLRVGVHPVELRKSKSCDKRFKSRGVQMIIIKPCMCLIRNYGKKKCERSRSKSDGSKN